MPGAFTETNIRNRPLSAIHKNDLQNSTNRGKRFEVTHIVNKVAGRQKITWIE